jgi:hypothetical protein
VVVRYVGYGGGRGDPFDWLTRSAVCEALPELSLTVASRHGGPEGLSGEVAPEAMARGCC